MSFQEEGFEIINDVVSANVIASITSELSAVEEKFIGGGIRNAEKRLTSVAALANSTNLISMASTYLQGEPKLVRSILFLKSPENNWLVSWHQDKTVTVSEKFDAEGWGPWSKKDEILHVQAPVDVLNKTITFRIHLDASTQDNGCLKLLPKSHLKGILTQQEINNYTKDCTPTFCVAPRGSALLMRPHILHASSKSNSSQARRVLHIEYSCYELPAPVQWA